ncbi:MAG TPA: tRNA dihydrouridine synthase DusB [Rhodospirillaceae bacterium]|nr:MAG: tRNA dihydrouridine synthase DusB [Alphaproteobacteria bacterium GWF2_58_20]HAU29312.1 tRNA dihydrouridine synthase DusB [Rhodospirillaceae bacterium]
MHAALQIASLSLPSRVVLAPMAGVTDAPFRSMVRRFGNFLTVSEMMPGREMLVAQPRMKRTSEDFSGQHPIAAQIAGCAPEIMAKAARMQAARGADLIDINMGCPAKKIVRGESGAALMRDLPLATEIIRAVIAAVDIPVTVKMRLGWSPENHNARELARIAQDCGAAAIIVHGRTRSQFYGGKADWEAIGRIRDALSIPVIGNGDITSGPDAVRMMEVSGVAGVMIGRAAYGRPWLLGQVHAFIEEGRILPDPSWTEKKALIIDHYRAMLDYYGQRVAVPLARKHLAWYLHGFPDAARLRAEIVRMTDPSEIMERLATFPLPNMF